nr:phosphoglycolate phosphatase 1B, chloroplastic-like [Tanacetum cinerariifolium]
MVVITRSSSTTVISSTPQRFPAKLSNPISSPQVSFSSSSVSVSRGRVGWNSNNKTMKTSVVASAAAGEFYGIFVMNCVSCDFTIYNEHDHEFTSHINLYPKLIMNSRVTMSFVYSGVIWKGDSLIEGVPETLELLRSKGKRLVFVTNNSTKSRKQYGKKFETLGLSVNEEEIFASSFAAAAYLQSIDFPKDKKIYVIGEEGILIELELAGFSYLGGPEDGGKKIELKPGFYMEHDENVGAVVVGFDRYFNYYKVQYGTLCIRENPGCLFLATNRDAVTHLTDAQEWAGGGSMVGALVGSTQREPLTVGKPSTFMMDYLANKFGITKSQICMVGDRLDTDILFGQNGGCKTLLVLSGVTSLSMLQNPNNSIQPDFYTNKISDFLSLKAATV